MNIDNLSSNLRVKHLPGALLPLFHVEFTKPLCLLCQSILSMFQEMFQGGDRMGDEGFISPNETPHLLNDHLVKWIDEALMNKSLHDHSQQF